MPENRRLAFLFVIGLLLFIVIPSYTIAGHLEPFKKTPIPRLNPQTPEKVKLGKMLFFDRRLSGDGTMSCATCHIPEMGFSDGQAISLSYPTTKNWRNSPTLINVAFSKFLFHDGRIETLEDQALFPMMSSFEMNQNLDFLEEEIRSVPEYLALFTKIFGDDDITRERVGMALAAFQRTLISRNAPLDMFLNGNKDALSPDALQGYEIFIGKGKCTDCHFGVNLIDNKFHALNVPENPDFQADPRVAATRRFVAKLNHYENFRTLNEDPGRYLITKDKKDWRAFKTPTLRDISKTDPYMHNGIFETLDEVIDFFNQGGGPSNTVLKPLGLNTEEKKDLKIFLVEALTGDDIKLTYPRVP
jgi:cytochrome c peroxidase